METIEPDNPTKMRRFGFGGLCFVVGLICFAIQKGDAALTPSPSWVAVLLWYSLATVLLVAGVWLWNQTANRHLIIRSSLTAIVIVGMIFFGYDPITQERQRERTIQAKSKPDGSNKTEPQPEPPKAATPTAEKLEQSKEATTPRKVAAQPKAQVASTTKVAAPSTVTNNAPGGIANSGGDIWDAVD
jgi:hypothetical protein